MKIIRPYGESRTEPAGDQCQRVLHDRTPERARHEIPSFATGHDKLVIAQWVSIMDKIATKPAPGNGATKAQRSFRDKLGKAAWDKLCENNRLTDAGQQDEQLKVLWRLKTHPYDKATYKPRKNSKKKPDVKGRWYSRFAGDFAPDEADVAAIAEAMDQHLHKAAKRLDGSRPDKRRGVIESRAVSIKKNVLKLPEATGEASFLEEAVLDSYFGKGDVAKEIYQAAKDWVNGTNGASKGFFRLPNAAEVLHKHWGRVFRDSANGNPMDVQTARAEYPELFALHMAVRGVYTQILKRRRTPKRKKATVPLKLPKHRCDLRRLIEHTSKNRELAGLIRTGKIIHYEAPDMLARTPADALAQGLSNPRNSPFLTSDRQAAIKRSEAFVRIWRHTIALANLTLRNWAAMNNPACKIGDVLGSKRKISEITGENNFNRKMHDEKMNLLFGARAGLVDAEEGIQKEFLKSILLAAIELRNTSFHFKGRGSFIRALKSLACHDDVKPGVKAIYKEDVQRRAKRLRDALVAINTGHYFDADQCKKIIDLLGEQQDPSTLPLPRFRRVLLRAGNTLKGEDALALPDPANRVKMEEYPALRCRYVLSKMLYEGSFRKWFTDRDAATVNKWIRGSIKRSTNAAKDLNAKGNKDKESVIVAKAAKLSRQLESGQKIEDFFFDLSRETASEMRVQRGYGHDGEAARKQAGHIDDLLCDVVARAFDAWIREEGLLWIVELKPETQLPASPIFDLEKMDIPDTPEAFEDWQAILYLFLHLVPVSEIGGLFHQLAKWEITSRIDNDLFEDDEAALKRLQSTLLLYLDMHDAKFEGGESLTGCTPFRELYCDSMAFDRVFPPDATGELDRRIPKRGLREIMRFGHRDLVLVFAQGPKVTHCEIDEYDRLLAGEEDGDLAKLQTQREEIHDKWRNNKKLSAENREAYVKSVRRIAKHRDLAARVTLSGLVFQHRLLMKVLGRLADYSGLFERDLYFVALGLLHRDRLKPENVFKDSGLEALWNGRIFEALKPANLKNPSWLRGELEQLFGKPRSGVALFHNGTGKSLQSIRNDTAHFDCLHSDPEKINLTACVNDIRRLMSYDRKLKNAVSKSVQELLAREKLTISWGMDDDHSLCGAKIGTEQATHMGGEKQYVHKSGQEFAIRENIHAQPCLKTVARLFRGKVNDPPDDVRSLDLATIDWEKRPEKTNKNRHQARTGGGKNRNRRRKRS